MMRQLEVWQGKFGNDYADRSWVDWRTRLPAFRQMLEGLPIKRVLEVGCNRGHNLIALAETLGDASNLVGIEPNRRALELAKRQNSLKLSHHQSTRVTMLYGNGFDLPFSDACFDLVFTSGVLVHVPLESLPLVMSEIYRVSRRYILAIEYFAEEETIIDYRGYDDLLWKRDTLNHYRQQFSDLTLLRSGSVGPEASFDSAPWWLLEKPSGIGRT